MNKILITLFTLLFLLTSFSVVAKEYIMYCKFGTYKLVDTALTKNLYFRIEGGWEEWCVEPNSTLIHKGDDTVCFKKTKSKSKVTLEDYREIFDSIIYKKTKIYDKPKARKNETTQCKKLK